MSYVPALTNCMIMSASASIANGEEPPLKRQCCEEEATSVAEKMPMEHSTMLEEPSSDMAKTDEAATAKSSMNRGDQSSLASVSPVSPSVTSPFILPGLTLLKPDVLNDARTIPAAGQPAENYLASANVVDESRSEDLSYKQGTSSMTERPAANGIDKNTDMESTPSKSVERIMVQHTSSVDKNGILLEESCAEPSLDPNGVKERQLMSFAAAAEAQKTNIEAEWQADSSDDSSLTSSSDSDDDSDDSSEEEDEGPLLSAEEAVAMMMRDDSPDSTAARSKKGEVIDPVMTKNEIREADPEVPDVQISTTMPIEELGILRNIIDKRAIVEGTCVDGDTVLNTGTVVCLPDRTVIGVVVEPIGQVKSPYYLVAFKKDGTGELPDGLEEGALLFFSTEHAVFAFSRELRRVKYTDASNLFDEEAQENEMEFSDDEQEAAYKRERKAETRRGRGDKRGRGDRRGRGGRGNREDHGPSPERERDHSPGYPSGQMNYEDDEDDDLYTPLKRPNASADAHPPPPRPNQHSYPQRRGRGANRARAAKRGGYDGRGGHQLASNVSPQSYDFNGQSFTYVPPQPPDYPPYSHYPASTRDLNSHPMFSVGTNMPYPNAGQTGQPWVNLATNGGPPQFNSQSGYHSYHGPSSGNQPQ